MARPTKLTPQVHERIVRAVRAGNYAEQSARAAGIAASTYYRWLEQGKQAKHGIQRELYEAVKRAEAEAEVHAVAVLRKQMPDDWRAALAYLERRHPQRWRRHQSTELTAKDGAPLTPERPATLDLTKLSDDELAFLEELQRRAAL